MSQSKTLNSASKRKLKMKLFGTAETKRCCFCRRVLWFEDATLEHVKPLSEGGSWDISNLKLSCDDCNQERGTDEFMAFLTFKRKGKDD
jgi:5-methylcytosine-specific restriction endonuclease McrA